MGMVFAPDVDERDSAMTLMQLGRALALLPKLYALSAVCDEMQERFRGILHATACEVSPDEDVARLKRQRWEAEIAARSYGILESAMPAVMKDVDSMLDFLGGNCDGL